MPLLYDIMITKMEVLILENKILQASYLTAENVERYRAMMRIFYVRQKELRGILFRPDVLELMQQYYRPDYSMKELEQDIEQLVSWGNLTKQQIMVQPKSIEEYLNSNFQYHISPEGQLFEELAEKLINIQNEVRGELNQNDFMELYHKVQEFNAQNDDGQLLSSWQKVIESFEKISSNTTNYISYINNNAINTHLQLESFIIYKDQFVRYLQDFIIIVQNLYYKLLHEIERIDQEKFVAIAKASYEKNQLRSFGQNEETEEEMLQRIKGQYQALLYWFKDTEEKASTYQNMMEQTQIMIGKITDFARYYGSELKQYRSRKKDYLKIAQWFMQESDLKQAHKMFAGIFGLQHTRHFYVPESLQSTSNRDDLRDLAPAVLSLGTRGRGARSERKSKPVKFDLELQKQQQKEYLEKQEAQKQQVLQYFDGNKLDLKAVKVMDKKTRGIILKWISRGYYSSKHLLQTEYGFMVRLHIQNDGSIVLKGEDGDLQMPHIVIERMERNESGDL